VIQASSAAAVDSSAYTVVVLLS